MGSTPASEVAATYASPMGKNQRAHCRGLGSSDRFAGLLGDGDIVGWLSTGRPIGSRGVGRLTLGTLFSLMDLGVVAGNCGYCRCN